MSSKIEINQPVHEPPVAELGEDEAPAVPQEGWALCLSGGGFRAMLFHAGALIRLNELGFLSRLARISSVSGGSITAAMLGLCWNRLRWETGFRKVVPNDLTEKLIEPLRQMARTSIDVSSIGWGLLLPGTSISDVVVKAYDKYLFDGATLQDLPDEREFAGEHLPAAPRFVITATNVKTGSLWRFAKPYMADYQVGIVDRPNVPLAMAVAASSAFPPFLSPMRMDLDDFTFRHNVPANAESLPRSLRAEAVLTDGGVYDNLGLEAVWKRYRQVLVSDGGHATDFDLRPADDWARHSRRLIALLEQQISSLRRRQLVSAFADRDDPHEGAYWGIQSSIASYEVDKPLPCPFEKTGALARIDTRLAALDDADQERIMNWGFAVCDAAMRRYVGDCKDSLAPPDFPFPESGL